MSKMEKGFTLVELMIVIAVIGILAAVVLPKFASTTGPQMKAKVAQVRGNLTTIRGSIRTFYMQNDTWPTYDGTGIGNGNIDVAGVVDQGTNTYALKDFYGKSNLPETPANGAGSYSESDVVAPGSEDTAGGWVYDTTTGDFKVDLPDGAATPPGPYGFSINWPEE